MRKCLFLLTTLFFLIAFALPTSASIGDYASYNKIFPEQIASPNGGFEIYVRVGDKWEFVERMEFDQFYREKTADLSGYIHPDQPVAIRIVQVGGQAAHIDAIRIGAQLPVMDRSDTLFKKISAKDFDVIDAFGKSMTYEFNVSLSGPVLHLVARVEGENISTEPFQFPMSNLYKAIDADADFYEYRLSAGLTGQPQQAEPFFSEFCMPATGHPLSNIYTWVWNDADYLYAYVDFTGDNTCDGGKDYAAMHINTPDGVKEFRVSMNETRFGEPAFEYTDRVAFEHKTYRFKVPREAVGSGAEALQVAFSAYGTLAPPPPTEYMHEILLDTDAASGGPVPVEDRNGVATIPNINYRVQVGVNPTTNTVLGGQVWKWNPSISDFEVTSWLTEQYPIAADQGIDGTDAVEWGVDLAALDNLTGAFTGYFHSSEFLAVNDYTRGFGYSINADVPTLSEWGMIFFALTLMTISVWVMRRRSKHGVIAAVLVICMIAGIAWAAAIVLDGNVSDWAAVSPVVSDVYNDQSGDLNEDIRYGFVTHSGGRIYFRVDYTGQDMVGGVQ